MELPMFGMLVQLTRNVLLAAHSLPPALCVPDRLHTEFDRTTGTTFLIDSNRWEPTR
jgi:hypothetical protein